MKIKMHNIYAKNKVFSRRIYISNEMSMMNEKKNKYVDFEVLEYQESVMAWNIKSNNTGYFSGSVFERVLRTLKGLK